MKDRLGLAFFTFAVWALYDAQYLTLAWVLGILTASHYITSYDRLLWMIKQ